MIEVKLFLYDAFEINLMSQFEAILAKKRAGEITEGATPTPPAPSTVNGPTAAPIEAVVVNAPAAPAAPPAEVDDVTMQRTITAYGQKHGVPATIARMQELFGVSKASLVPVERRAEFVGAFAV